MGAETVTPHLLNEYEMVVMVALIIAVAAIIITAIAYRRARPDAKGARDLPAENRRLEGEVTTLKERVAVLERIATDKNHRLEHEFERLRSD